MNKLYCIIIIVLTCRICEAQNLVLNGDFETFSLCPTYFDQLNKAVPWMSPTYGSPEYFNPCAISTFPDVGVPENEEGYQNAHSGVGYGGGYLFYPSLNHRQYLEGAFSSPLISGETYYFEMYINLANLCRLAIENIGVYFSDSAVMGITNALPLNFIPQISNTNGIITDTMNWTLINGYYLANGGESNLIIGNFAPHDSLVNYLLNNPSGFDPSAYYYVDDVSLTLTTGIFEENQDIKAIIYPTIFMDELSVHVTPQEPVSFILYDTGLRKILQRQFTKFVSLKTEYIAKGIYVYEVSNKNGVIKNGKIVKQ